MNPLGVLVEKYSTTCLAAPFFFVFFRGVSRSMTSPRRLGTTLLLGGLVGFLALRDLCHRGWWLVLVPSLIDCVVVVTRVVRVQQVGGIACN